MALSKNFEKEMNRRKTPKCYGKHKETSVEDKKGCGMCWFAHACKEGKELPKKAAKKKETK